MKYVVALIGLLVFVLGGAHALWKGTSATLERVMESGAPGDQALSSDALPPPVSRYFARALPPGQKPIRTARLTQEGEFFINGAWAPLRADQVVGASPPAFMWDARITVAPLLNVYVRDSYLATRASMLARVLAVYPVVNQSGTPELAAGALMRYLGEAVWLPTRLMPGRGLTWEAVDERSARATLTDGPTTVSLLFRFDEQDDIAEISSPDRFREVNGSYVPTPWRVRALGQVVHQGIRMMSPAVVEWILPDGPLPYWRASITSAQYVY